MPALGVVVVSKGRRDAWGKGGGDSAKKHLGCRAVRSQVRVDIYQMRPGNTHESAGQHSYAVGVRGCGGVGEGGGVCVCACASACVQRPSEERLNAQETCRFRERQDSRERRVS